MSDSAGGIGNVQNTVVAPTNEQQQIQQIMGAQENVSSKAADLADLYKAMRIVMAERPEKGADESDEDFGKRLSAFREKVQDMLAKIEKATDNLAQASAKLQQLQNQLPNERFKDQQIIRKAQEVQSQLNKVSTAAAGLADTINGAGGQDSMNKADEKAELKASLLKLEIATGAINEDGSSLKEDIALLKVFMGSSTGVGTKENKLTGNVANAGRTLPIDMGGGV